MERAGRTNTVMAKLSVIGDLLMLQLVFLVLSLGIVLTVLVLLGVLMGASSGRP